MDYTDILNNISAKLNTIISSLGVLDQLKQFENLIFLALCLLLILFAIRGE